MAMAMAERLSLLGRGCDGIRCPHLAPSLGVQRGAPVPWRFGRPEPEPAPGFFTGHASKVV